MKSFESDKILYVVYEDNHGDVSYWGSEQDAINECCEILEDCCFSEDVEERCKENIRNYGTCDIVGYRKVFMNKRWLS